MSICLPQRCLALANGLPPPGDPLFRDSPGWWVRLQSVGHKHRTCSHVLVPENLEIFRELFYAYMSTPAMPGPCECICFWGQQMKKTVDFLFPGKTLHEGTTKKIHKGSFAMTSPPFAVVLFIAPHPSTSRTASLGRLFLSRRLFLPQTSQRESRHKHRPGGAQEEIHGDFCHGGVGIGSGRSAAGCFLCRELLGRPTKLCS